VSVSVSVSVSMSASVSVPVSMCQYMSRGVLQLYELQPFDLHGVDRRGGGLGSRPKKNVLGEIGGWGRVPFNETYAPSLSTTYDGG